MTKEMDKVEKFSRKQMDDTIKLIVERINRKGKEATARD